ncbi:MAG TPA: glycosyltransferase [Verrucomicrobiota bacterium]|nr:glycosyltransferase [Verrucomicrobiota bacterium]HRT09837.1 glycosyltransferase [Candidatus Paceibacterota bacterium]HRT58633.1 glycosyltransferase [Candidatus Paceibacterota bacterium]
MSATLTTTIPVRNGQEFILQTLESLARQHRRPDHVLVLDNCSTDATPEIVRTFKGLQVEYQRNPTDLGLFGNFNRCLDFASETDYLHILHADDVITPEFYEVMTRHLEACPGRGMAWCLDERIDEQGRRLSVSGKADGTVKQFEMDEFLALKAEISNQAFCATLLKTNRQPAPERFPTNMPILGDMVFWALYGRHCQRLVRVNLPLAKYRWHGSNQTVFRAPSVEALIVDEWRTMQQVEALREHPPGFIRRAKLKGLLAVRSGIKAKRFRQLGNHPYAAEIVKTASQYTGLPLWLAGQFLVELRELIVFKIGRRPRHPQNVFS